MYRGVRVRIKRIEIGDYDGGTYEYKITSDKGCCAKHFMSEDLLDDLILALSTIANERRAKKKEAKKDTNE